MWIPIRAGTDAIDLNEVSVVSKGLFKVKTEESPEIKKDIDDELRVVYK